MIKFFRHIRKRLLETNRITKYLVYAIGEIVLVVIGILIALSINNWNEDQKLLRAEKATIASLKLEFEKNLNDLERNIGAMNAFIGACEVLLENTGPEYAEGTIKNVDSLISMTFRMSVWDPSLFTLNDIKNSGKLSNLSNENLKIKLIEWESFYTNLLQWGDFYVTRGNKYFDFLIENAVNRNLIIRRDSNLTKSRFNASNEALMKNITFENFVADKVALNGFMLEYYLEAQEILNDIIIECNSYND